MAGSNFPKARLWHIRSSFERLWVSLYAVLNYHLTYLYLNIFPLFFFKFHCKKCARMRHCIGLWDSSVSDLLRIWRPLLLETFSPLSLRMIHRSCQVLDSNWRTCRKTVTSAVASLYGIGALGDHFSNYKMEKYQCVAWVRDFLDHYDLFHGIIESASALTHFFSYMIVREGTARSHLNSFLVVGPIIKHLRRTLQLGSGISYLYSKKRYSLVHFIHEGLNFYILFIFQH